MQCGTAGRPAPGVANVRTSAQDPWCVSHTSSRSGHAAQPYLPLGEKPAAAEPLRCKASLIGAASAKLWLAYISKTPSEPWIYPHTCWGLQVRLVFEAGKRLPVAGTALFKVKLGHARRSANAKGCQPAEHTAAHTRTRTAVNGKQRAQAACWCSRSTLREHDAATMYAAQSLPEYGSEQRLGVCCQSHLHLRGNVTSSSMLYEWCPNMKSHVDHSTMMQTWSQDCCRQSM